MAQGTEPIGAHRTLDTSVYVGALNSRGFGSRFFAMAQGGVIRIDISDAILDETIRVLRDKFGWDGYRLHDAKLRLAGFANRVVPTQVLDVIKEDPPDNRILECAVEAGSQYIVTWDKDRLGSYADIRIVRAADFLKQMGW